MNNKEQKNKEKIEKDQDYIYYEGILKKEKIYLSEVFKIIKITLMV